MLVVVIVVGIIGVILRGIGSSTSTASTGSPVATQAASKSPQTVDTFVDDHQFHWIVNPLTGHSGDPYHNYSLAFLALHMNEMPENSGLIVQGVIAALDQRMVILRDADYPNVLAACVLKEGELEWMTTHSEGDPYAMYGEFVGPSPYPISGVEGMPMLNQCESIPTQAHVITPAKRTPRARSKH